MRLEDDKYEEIKQTVIDSFLEYDIKCVPISAFEMATKMGITIKPYSAFGNKERELLLAQSLDGFSVETVRGKWTIYYNDDCKNYGRINQTIMHEIGHFALGHIESSAEEESEAAFFAKYALAPPPLIHSLGNHVSPEWIQKTFNLSLEAAHNAYKYYKGWLQYGESEYTIYEEKILHLFKIA